jgi:hypothetical protein
MKTTRLAVLASLALLSSACNDSPRDDYQAYRSRTASAYTDGGAGPVSNQSTLQNIEGRWLLNSLLFGGIEVGLRVIFEAADDQDPPRRYSARIWLWDMPDDAEPLVITETELDEAGRFELVANPLNLPGAVLNRVDPVEAIVFLHARTPDAGHWCGGASGEVTRPLSLPLNNATFNAVRDPDGALDLSDVAFRCADEPEPEPPADAGVGPVERPEGPDFSAYPSTYRDLTGDWLFTADFDIPLQLWLSLRAIPNADGGGSLDGALRSTRAVPGEPALATFTTQVDPEGRFEIWLPDFVLSVGRLNISADILLTAVSLEDGFCGGTAGAIREPEAFAQSLDITYAVVPFVPGEGADGNAPNVCP